MGIRGGDGGTSWREQGGGGGEVGGGGDSAVLQIDLEEVGGGRGVRGGRQWGLGEESGVDEGCNCSWGGGVGGVLYTDLAMGAGTR